jgi:hypothetical protein
MVEPIKARCKINSTDWNFLLLIIELIGIFFSSPPAHEPPVGVGWWTDGAPSGVAAE